MTQNEVLELAQCAWESPVVLAPKPDGSWRFCIDYRLFIAIIIRVTYPLPGMDDYIYSLGEANIVTTFDANYGYGQVPIHDVDKEKPPSYA